MEVTLVDANHCLGAAQLLFHDPYPEYLNPKTLGQGCAGWWR